MSDDFDDMAEAEAERQARVAAERLTRWDADTPVVFREDWPVHPLVDKWAVGLLEGKPTNLLLVGDPGTTKTWHCYRAIRQALAAGWRGQPMMCTAKFWRQAIAYPVDWAALTRMIQAGVLVLDDAGSTAVVDRDAEHLGIVIDERWKTGRPTVVNSNVADLRTMFGPRIASRLAARHLLIEFDGPDRRREVS